MREVQVRLAVVMKNGIGKKCNLEIPFFCLESGTDLSALIVTTAMLGKFGIAGSYAIVFLYATELFPTVVRCKLLHML